MEGRLSFVPVRDHLAHIPGHARRDAPPRNGAAFASVTAVAVTWLLALTLAWLYVNLGPPAQRISIRWTPDVSVTDRIRIERELRLGEAVPGALRTWSYPLQGRSRDTIARLVSHPSVEDARLDRPTFRGPLGQAAMARRLGSLAETEWLPLASLALALVGFSVLWLRWRDVRAITGFAVTSVLAWWDAGGRRDRMASVGRAEFCYGLALGLLFLAPLLAYGPVDDEEGALGIFAGQVHYRALLHGRWLFWLNNLGFGTPLPIGQRLDFHPVFALAGLLSLRATLSVLWVVHVAAMVVYFLRLAAMSGIGPRLRIALLACYLFSAVSICLFYNTDWVSHIVAWTMYPIVVFYVRQAVTSEASTNFWLASTRLALLLGVWVLNSHPGYIAPLAIVLAIYTLVLAPIRGPVYGSLLVALVLCALASAERLYFFASELRMFPASALRDIGAGFTPGDYATAALVPLVPIRIDEGLPFLALRLPFLGLVLALAVVASLFRSSFLQPRDRHTRAAAVACVAAAILSLVPAPLLSRLVVVSGGWTFRDPMVFFGLLAGGVALQRGLESQTLWRRMSVWTLIVVQLWQQSVVVDTGLRTYFRELHLEFYQHQGRTDGLAGLLVQHASTSGPRLYLSEHVQSFMRGSLSAYGIHFVTDLVFLGVNPINAWFKGISMDRLYPSPWLMHGRITGERDAIENGTLLDVLGVNMVLTTEAEGPVPPGLVVIDRMPLPTFRREDSLVLLANPDAWPSAVLVSTDVRAMTLGRRASCSHDRALCGDFTTFAGARLPDRVSLTGTDGRYTARFTPARQERVLFVSATYRPEWEARSPAGSLQVIPVADAFLGVNVPAGVEVVYVAFVPRVRILLTWLSGVTLTCLLVAFGVAWRRRKVQ